MCRNENDLRRCEPVQAILVFGDDVQGVSASGRRCRAWHGRSAALLTMLRGENAEHFLPKLLSNL